MTSTALEQIQEDPIEPDLAICDAHHHLWDRPGNRYLIEDLAEDVSGHNVVSTVFIECMARYSENGPEAFPISKLTHRRSHFTFISSRTRQPDIHRNQDYP